MWSDGKFRVFSAAAAVLLAPAGLATRASAQPTPPNPAPPVAVPTPAQREVSRTRTVRSWVFSSDKHQVALLEFFTSQECGSCPGIERFLSTLPRERLGFDMVVPLAFHVSYWPHLGWTDRFTRPEFNERHKKMAAARENAPPVTPQLYLNGSETRLRGGHLLLALDDFSSRPAAYRLSMQIEMALDRKSIELIAQAEKTLSSPVRLEMADAQFAIFEMGLSTKIDGGENKGQTLEENYVVRRMLNEFQIMQGDDLVPMGIPRIPISTDWNPDRIGVAGWIRLRNDGRIVQAVGGLLDQSKAKTIQVPE
jgi:hypothetical protein